MVVLLPSLPLEEPLHCSFGAYHHCTFVKLVFHVKWWWHSGWMWKTYRSADCACTHEMVLVRLAFPKSKVLHNLLFRTMPIFCATFFAVPGRVPMTSLPSCSSTRRSWHILSVPESSNGVPTVPIMTVVATNRPSAPSLLKT